MPQPKVTELRPPGGARTRDVGRSEIMLPQFWLVPEAQALLEVPPVRPEVACM